MATAGVAVNNTKKKLIFKKGAPFTDCIPETVNMQIDDVQKIEEEMHIYNLIEYSNAYSKISGRLRWFRSLDNNGDVTDFHGDNNSA